VPPSNVLAAAPRDRDRGASGSFDRRPEHSRRSVGERPMTIPGPRFGVWALTGGTWGSHHHPQEPVDPSWERNRAQILLAEQLGYDATLLAQHTYSPAPMTGPLEAWTASAALAALTERIEIITAIKPFLYHPVVLAKMALQIEEISHGRFAINFVNAFLRDEAERAGLMFLEHDERYVYGREWLEAFTRLISGETVSFHGRYFQIDEYRLTPTDRFRARPRIYQGGESSPARDLAADHADVWFINGQPADAVASLIDDLRRRPRRRGPLRYALAAFVITRESEEEADAAIGAAWELDRLDRPHYEHWVTTRVDPNAVMFQTFKSNPHIGTNGGTAAGLVGSYEQVAKRILEFHEIGIELFMLQFQPFEAEMERFAREVIPRVRHHLRRAA
jgi:alkanesulfonate monooxygenase